jgi:hypothetical protein
MSDRAQEATAARRRSVRAALVGGCVAVLLACQGASQDGAAQSDAESSEQTGWLEKVQNLVGSNEPSEEEAAAAAHDTATVKCELNGSVSFMSRDDCLQRRGKPF